jgi:hypothetical protein
VTKRSEDIHGWPDETHLATLSAIRRNVCCPPAAIALWICSTDATSTQFAALLGAAGKDETARNSKTVSKLKSKRCQRDHSGEPPRLDMSKPLDGFLAQEGMHLVEHASKATQTGGKLRATQLK